MIPRSVAAVAVVALSVVLVAVFPRSILAFLAFQGSLLFVYVASHPRPGSARASWDWRCSC